MDEADETAVTEVCIVNQYVICERCKVLVPDVDNFDDHICEDVSKTEANEEMVVVESSSKGFHCEYCNKTFAQSSNLKRHERIHTGDRPYVCATCDRSFTQYSNLKAHLRLHTGQRPYVCTQCNRSFTQSSNLYKHMRGHDSVADEQNRRRFMCALCSRGFADNVLRMHLRTHTGERPYKCEQCDKSFTQESNLRRHNRTHTGERPFACGICQRSFSQSNNLKTHLALHVDAAAAADAASPCVADGEPGTQTVIMWPCDKCDALFTRQSKLDRHRRTHGRPRLIVVTPSGLRLNAEQVVVEDPAAETFTPDTGDSSDTNNTVMIVSSWPATE